MLPLLKHLPWLLYAPGVRQWLGRRAMKACQTQDAEGLKACLGAGLAVDALLKNPESCRGFEPLVFHVAWRGFEKGLRVLLDHGVDPMTTASSWDHPQTCDHLLLQLVHSNSPEYCRMARMLVEAGADVDASKGWELNWDSTFMDECGDPIGDHSLMSFREVVLQKKSQAPEWMEVLTFADNLKRALALEERLPGVGQPEAMRHRF